MDKNKVYMAYVLVNKDNEYFCVDPFAGGNHWFHTSLVQAKLFDSVEMAEHCKSRQQESNDLRILGVRVTELN